MWVQWKSVPRTHDSVWIISRDELQTFLTESEHAFLETKINRLYKAGFPDYKESSLFCHIDYVFCFYIRGRFPSKEGYPHHSDMPVILDQIVSTLKMEWDEGWCIWNVCNDPLVPKGGFMRRLFDMVLGSIHKRRVYLHVAYKNPTFEKAVRLYLEKGFRHIEPTRFEDIAVTMELSKQKQTWEEFSELIRAKL